MQLAGPRIRRFDMGLTSSLALQAFRARLWFFFSRIWLIVFILGCPITFLVLGAAIASMAKGGRRGGSRQTKVWSSSIRPQKLLICHIPCHLHTSSNIRGRTPRSPTWASMKHVADDNALLLSRADNASRSQEVCWSQLRCMESRLRRGHRQPQRHVLQHAGMGD